MLVPDPKVVRRLLTRYASLQIARAERDGLAAAARELEDVSYTLCVLMGAEGVREAIARADALLVSGASGAHGKTGVSTAVRFSPVSPGINTEVCEGA
ncbi:DUF5133 domain-containing protein [Streptomyces sp. NPDC059378]|uniref:DUF5133 domain-containing protein n=1 Tax=Streptomyces sp. NPDC059378 TaxID=3346815 RepID=UPI00367459A0